MKALFCSNPVFVMQVAQIELGLSKIRNDIGQRATGNDAGIDCDTFSPTCQILKLQYLVSQFNDCIAPFFRFNTCMSRAPIRSKFVPRSEERRVGKECRSRWSPY